MKSISDLQSIVTSITSSDDLSPAFPAADAEAAMDEMVKLVQEDEKYRFNQFKEVANTIPVNVTAVKSDITEEELKEADVQMLNASAITLMVALNQVRTIAGAVSTVRAVTTYIKDRRAILGYPVRDGREGSGNYLDAV